MAPRDQRVACPDGFCPLVDGPGQDVRILASLPTDTLDTGYVIALDRPRRSVVLMFRGSRSAVNFGNILPAAVSAPVATNLCRGCKAARAFIDTYETVRLPIAATIRAAINLNPGFKVVVTGHSLGGILSHLAALDLRIQNNDYTVDLVSTMKP
jgi:predicted lipase